MVYIVYFTGMSFVWDPITLLFQLELIVLSEDGLASSTDILHVVSSLERKITYKDAQAFLKVLAGDKWLDEVVGWLAHFFHDCILINLEYIYNVLFVRLSPCLVII